MTTGRTAALMAYLVANRQPHSRVALGHLLWNADSEQQARSNLRYALRDLRKAVGDYLIVSGESVACNPNLPLWVDSITFAEHIRQSTHLDSSKESQILQDLLNLYAGEFMAGFQLTDAPAFDEWVAAQRRHLHDLFVQGLHLRIQQQVAAGEYEAGLELNRYLLSLEPWREEAHRQRMFLFAQLGQRSAALKQYELCCQLLLEELDVPPMRQTTTLYEQIRSGQWFTDNGQSRENSVIRVAVAGFPQPQPRVLENWQKNPSVNSHEIANAPHSLQRRINLGSMPEPVYFVGREKELTILNQCIVQERYPLFAVLGLAGQGKSALAAAFVHNEYEEQGAASHSFQHIIWRSMSDGPSCIETLQGWLRDLDARERAALTSFDQLVARLFVLLQEQRCLLVLDGLEAVTTASSATSLPEAEAYDRLFRLFLQREHRSCLLLTSQTRPKALTALDERDRAFRWLELGGLSSAESVELLSRYGLGNDSEVLDQLSECYAGNPQLLTQAAALIYDLFGGDAQLFAEENIFFLGEIGDRLYRQLQGLSPLERNLLQKLADVQNPLSRQSLWQALPPDSDKSAFLLALRSLQNTSLIMREENQIGLPDLVGKFLQEHRLAYA